MVRRQQVLRSKLIRIDVTLTARASLNSMGNEAMLMKFPSASVSLNWDAFFVSVGLVSNLEGVFIVAEQCCITDTIDYESPRKRYLFSAEPSLAE